jgi:tocopherol cyclase
MPDLRNIWRPALYHGRGKRPLFFEGWYCKLLDASEQYRYATIPGVFIGREPGASHAFVQILDGATDRTEYHRYPFEAFQAARDEFDIRVGPNRFRAGRIEMDIDRPEGRMAGELSFACGAPWPVTLISPDIMGPYTFAPFMECCHGVLSFDHTIAGSLSIDRAAYDFTGGRGYIEKDWGQAFPKAWIWMQSNHFGASAAGSNLTASVAIIPWLRGAVPGFAGPRHTAHRLEIVAWRVEGGLLHSPERAVMLQRVLESLTARIDVRLLAMAGGQEQDIFDGTGRHAGLEIVGPVQGIQKLARVI